jgi:hypothetical protein
MKKNSKYQVFECRLDRVVNLSSFFLAFLRHVNLDALFLWNFLRIQVLLCKLNQTGPNKRTKKWLNLIDDNEKPFVKIR